MQDNTGTLEADPAADPAAQGSTGEPAPGAAQQAPTDASQPGPESGDTAAQGERDDGSDDGEGEPTPWSGAADIGSLMEVGEVKSHVDGLLTDAREQAKEETNTFWRKEFRPVFEQQRHQVGEMNRNIKQFRQSWNRYVEEHEGEIDYDRMSDVFSEHEDAFAVLKGYAQQDGRRSGAAEMLDRILEGADVSADTKAAYLERLLAEQPDPMVIGEIVEDAAAALIERATEKATREAETKTRSNQEDEMRNEERQQGKPVARVASGKGGAKVPTLAELRAMSRDEVAKIPREVRDRIMAGS